MRKLYKLGKKPIMFGDIKNCGACEFQDQLLRKKFGKGYYYLHKHVSLSSLPFSIKGTKSVKGVIINALPTWYIPTKNGNGYLREGVIKSVKNLVINSKKKPKRSFKFGNNLGTLAKLGRNFSETNPGFNNGTSWLQETTQKWGNDVTLSGTLGREFGPGNTDKIYSNEYYNGLRMARPGGDLETALSLNRAANMYNENNKADPVTYSPGLIYNSSNPQIVSMTAFGLKKSKKIKPKSKKSKKSKKIKPKSTTQIMKSLNKYENYIKVHKSGNLIRCMNNAYCDNYNYRSINYQKLLPVWQNKINELKKQLSKPNSFGNSLYDYMGPVPEKQYLINKNTFNDNYTGGGQGDPGKPAKSANTNLFINSSKPYKPFSSFGKKSSKSSKKIKPGENTTLIVNKKGKIKVKKD
jgi:hypothetical protein